MNERKESNEKMVSLSKFVDIHAFTVQIFFVSSLKITSQRPSSLLHDPTMPRGRGRHPGQPKLVIQSMHGLLELCLSWMADKTTDSCHKVTLRPTKCSRNVFTAKLNGILEFLTFLQQSPIELPTVCFTDLGKLNLLMVVRFKARANFCYCISCLKKWSSLQRWSNWTRK